MKYLFKTILLLTILSLIFLHVEAQQKHFIYIESEDKQPFAVVLKGKVFSSSDYGYVIVPRLTDGDYNFAISFPLNKFPEQSFRCSINKKDIGFTLKNLNEKGWALTNMQTQKISMSGADNNADNAFGNMLSEVVSDSNLTRKNEVALNKPEDSSAFYSADDTNSITNNNIAQTNEPAFITDSLIQLKKISESEQDTGVNMIFVDNTASNADTINVFVPVSDSNNINSVNEIKNSADNLNDGQQNEPANSTAINESIKSDIVSDTNYTSATNPFYKPHDNPVNAELNNKASDHQSAAIVQVTSNVKQDCVNMISDEEFERLKRKMFVQNNNNSMLQNAVKYSSNKCLTTAQVKALGNLFSSDDGRYNLYDALYNNVYDYGNYPLLESQILDSYYRKRFEAMLR